MQLMQYVSDVITKNQYPNSFPAYLDISRSFVQYCYNFFTTGESRGMELGVTLSMNGKGELAISDKVIEGNATGINLPYVEDNLFFGDLHCHPANSIGHISGYAAHSPEDVASMRSQTSKPVFLRFVCSGGKIYLMVYRNGHSAIVEKNVFGIRDAYTQQAHDYFNRRCPITEEEKEEAFSKMSNSAQLNAYTVYMRSKTPGLGNEMERLSIAGGKEIARACNLGFFAGDQGYGVSVWFYDYLRIYLQQ